MNFPLLVLLLALLWTAISGSFSGLNLLLGIAIALLAVFVLRGVLSPSSAVSRTPRILSLAVLFVRELIVSALRVTRIVLTPNLRSVLRPAVVAFPLSVRSDAEITLLANLITLTPGTLSIDLSPDRNHLYVHVLDLGNADTLIQEIANGFESKVRQVFA